MTACAMSSWKLPHITFRKSWHVAASIAVWYNPLALLQQYVGIGASSLNFVATGCSARELVKRCSTAILAEVGPTEIDARIDAARLNLMSGERKVLSGREIECKSEGCQLSGGVDLGLKDNAANVNSFSSTKSCVRIEIELRRASQYTFKVSQDDTGLGPRKIGQEESEDKQTRTCNSVTKFNQLE
ncbi:hypothetical protein DFH06DRAFT_1407095 [Mycena polygramma]|nr:hypothetical protein DFH06DRAFT_1407095 [Mycena polygramma]